MLCVLPYQPAAGICGRGVVWPAYNGDGELLLLQYLVSNDTSNNTRRLYCVLLQEAECTWSRHFGVWKYNPGGAWRLLFGPGNRKLSTSSFEQCGVLQLNSSDEYGNPEQEKEPLDLHSVPNCIDSDSSDSCKVNWTGHFLSDVAVCALYLIRMTTY